MAKMFRILGKRGRITIPYEIRQKVGFTYNDLLSFEEMPDGQSVMIKREKICNHCNFQYAEQSEKDSLYSFLDDLSDEQKKATLLHLLIVWERNHRGQKHGNKNISN